MSASIEQVSVRMTPDGRLSRADAAAFLGLRPKTLAMYQSSGIGPLARKVGGRVFYRLVDLEAFRDTGAREAGKHHA